MENIGTNYRKIRDRLPPGVEIVVAAKARRTCEVAEVIAADATIIGENYVQEAEKLRKELEPGLLTRVRFDMIGHLQRNKVSRALSSFDMIQTVDSLKVARAIDKRMAGAGPLPVLVQVNVAGESSKYGIPPGELIPFLHQISVFRNLMVKGLMTVEPFFDDPELARPYFKKMRELFQHASENIAGVEMETLSMGMSGSCDVAVEEGSTMVRVGTAIFGPRP